MRAIRIAHEELRNTPDLRREILGLLLRQARSDNNESFTAHGDTLNNFHCWLPEGNYYVWFHADPTSFGEKTKHGEKVPVQVLINDIHSVIAEVITEGLLIHRDFLEGNYFDYRNRYRDEYRVETEYIAFHILLRLLRMGYKLDELQG